jgi:hypothetical protein
MFPNPAVTFTGVSPGDAIHVAVGLVSGQWHLTFTDLTMNAGFSVLEHCPSGSICRNSSAEVISEVPNGGPPNALLADYGELEVTHIGVVGGSRGIRGNLINSAWVLDSINEVSPVTHVVMQTASTLAGACCGSNGGYGNQSFTTSAINPGG